MSTVVKDLGAVSAYAYAVEKGYTGTEAEFAELMADYAEVGQRAEDAANSALESKTAAQTAATTATNKATEATTAATTATNKASEAQTSAQTASTKASEASQSASQALGYKNDAESAKTASQTAQGLAESAKDSAVQAKTGAESAKADAESARDAVQSSAAQITTNAEDITQLKEDLQDLEGSVVKTVNGIAPDANGNVEVETGGDTSELEQTVSAMNNFGQTTEEEDVTDTFLTNQYYNIGTIGNTVSLTTINQTDYACTYWQVKAGDGARISANGGGGARRLWAFTDADFKVLSNSAQDYREDNAVITAEVDGYLFINVRSEYPHTIVKITHNAITLHDKMDGVDGDIADIDARVDKTDSLTPMILPAYPIVKSADSNIVTFTDGSDKVWFDKVVTNVPYSGESIAKADLIIAGLNLFNLDDVVTKRFITKNTDGSLTANGQYVSLYSGERSFGQTYSADDMARMPYLKAGVYYRSYTSGTLYINTVDSSGTPTNVLVGNDGKFTIPNDSRINISITGTVADLIIESEAHRGAYEKFKGQIIRLLFADFTWYGGSIDYVNGIVTSLYASDGSLLTDPILHEMTIPKPVSCYGLNQVYSDVGTVEVNYRADNKLYVDQRNLSESLLQYNVDAVRYGNMTNNLFMKDGENVISVAHRGYSFSAPENTLPAYKLAVEKGFLVAETDVVWTTDGVPVLLHDLTINRTARNADGTTISGDVYIKDITYAQALEYDYGIRNGSEYAGTKIPTFTEFIRFCKDVGLMPCIELKINTQTFEQTKSIVDIVIAHGMINRVMWVSNFPNLLMHVLSIHQGANVGVVCSALTANKLQAVAEIRNTYPCANVSLSCQASNLTASDYENIIAQDIPLNLWVLDTEADIINMNPYCTSVTSNKLNAAEVLKTNAMT